MSDWHVLYGYGPRPDAQHSARFQAPGSSVPYRLPKRTERRTAPAYATMAAWQPRSENVQPTFRFPPAPLPASALAI